MHAHTWILDVPTGAMLGLAAGRQTGEHLGTLARDLLLASSRTTATERVVLPSGGYAIRKTWHWPRAKDRVSGAFRSTLAARSPAERESQAAIALRSLPGGPFAPTPLAWSETRSAGVLLSCCYLIEEIGEATDLATFLSRSRDSALRRRVLSDLAVRTRAMHDAGICDLDMHPRNVLVESHSARTWKIDAPKQSRRKGRPANDAARADDLGALDVGLRRLCDPAERAGFFDSYHGTSDARARQSLDRMTEDARRRHDPKESLRLPGNRVSRGDNDR